MNSSIPRETYKEILLDDYFVDKSMLIKELIPAIGKRNRYFCITRPRRFGKTVMANMVGAFFERTEEISLFDQLAISTVEGYDAHLNNHNVIYIDFSRTPENCTSYKEYILRIIQGIKSDVFDAFPDLEVDIDESIWDILQEAYKK